MNFLNVDYEKKEGVGIIKLNRPDRKNALNLYLLQEIIKLLDQVEEDDNLDVLIITGGSEYFSVGADLKEIDKDYSTDLFLETIRLTLNKIENFKRPVLAAISGICFAGGFELAMACDLRIASINASFCLPEVRFGALAFAGGTQRLPRQIGMAKAKELHFTGEPIDAQEAYRIGFLNEVVEADKVMEAALKLARKLQGVSRRALSLCKFLINKGMRMEPEVGKEYEAELSKLLIHDRKALEEDMRRAAEQREVYKKIFVEE